MKKLMLLFAFFSIIGMQINAQKTVTGTVNDDTGENLPGVSVLVKGTTVGAMTNADGTYSIDVPEGSTTLMFSYMGLKTQEVVISGDVVNVSLKASEDEGLEEVVVTALGIVREKREITYQTQKVSEEELTIVSHSKAAAGLVGKVAGLQINIQDNGVNPTSQILLRGLRSISGNNSALIVIDGSVASQGAFDDLNPNDIGSINVLKGATAAALYGSRAANGAILVSTKKGRKGDKLTVGLNSSYTVDQVAYMPDFQDEHGTGWAGVYDNIENTNWGPRFDGTVRQIGPTFADGTYQAVPYAPVQDNLLDFYNVGSTIINTLYLSGGNKESSFYLSANDLRASGIVPDDMHKRNSFRVNASKKVGKVELSLNSSYYTDKTDIVGSSIGDQNRPLYWFVLNTPANIPLSTYSDWDNPESYGYADNYYNAYYQNPYWAIGTNRNIDYTNRITGNISVSYDILKWMNFSTRIGINNAWGNGKDWRAAQAYNPDLQPSHSYVSSFVKDSEFKSNIYTADAILAMTKNFDAISVKTIFGATTYASEFRSSLMTAVNLSIPDFYDISNGTGSLAGSVNESKKRTYGFFGDVTVGYNQYIFLNFSGRNDWTSTLKPENNSYFYPSVGLSFVATDAIPSIKSNILSYAKLTVSNSTVYNDLNPYQINESYSQSGAFPYGNVNGFYLSGTTVDANISKEKINTTELGLNLSFFKSRVSLNSSLFMTKTTDLITSISPSTSSGSNNFLTNIGSLEGQGIELGLTGAVIDNKALDLRWDVNLTFTKSETIVKEIKEGSDEVALTDFGTGWGIYAVKDLPFPQVKANVYETDGNGHIVVDAASGYPKTKEGMESLGKTTPDYILGLNSTVSFKGVSLSATFDYRTGHVYYEQGSDAMEFTGRSIASVSAHRQDFIIPNSVIETSPGVFVENTNVPISNGIMGYWQNNFNNVKSNYVKDATALKIRELAIGYEFPKSMIEKMQIQKLKIGLIARNLMTWLPEENRFADPEFNNTLSNSIGVGGYFQSPPTKSYGVNLVIEF